MNIDTENVVTVIKLKAYELVKQARAENAKLTEKQRIVVASTISAVVATTLYALIS